MQPSQILASAATPLLALSLWTVLPGQADNRASVDVIAQLPPLPVEQDAGEAETVLVTDPKNTEKTDSPLDQETAEEDKLHEQVWLKTASRVRLADLARLLNVPIRRFAETNNSGTAHVFSPGDWVRVKGVNHSVIAGLPTLDLSTLQTTAPMTAPPPVSDVAKVQRGDSLASFLKRHGLSSSQLKQYNPGLNLAELTIGREVRVSKAALGQKLLAIRPTVSGGASWPKRPTFPLRERPSMASKGYMWPTKGVFTSGYGWRWGRMHKGIDIANNTGTSIHAARDGIVSYSGWSSGYGYLVEITHADGESTRYAHNSRLLVKKGQMVTQGSRISLMGSTGRSTGPHLHFEIRRSGGAAVNPLSKLPARKA